jgi:PEP-CTERM motif
VLGRRFLLSLVIALFSSTLASANSTTVNMTSLYTTNVSGGHHTYPYYFSINGEKATPMLKHAPASGPRPQEFIGYRGTPVSMPEPASLLLLSTGLIGIAGLVRRKLPRA